MVAIPYKCYDNLTTFVKRVDDGFEINLSVNEVNEDKPFGINIYYNGTSLTYFYINCDEEPKEKVYYPYIEYSFSKYSEAQLI